MKIPKRYRKPPAGYPDLNILCAVDLRLGIHQAALESHLAMLHAAGTLTRTYHPVLRVAGWMPLHGGAQVLDPGVTEVIRERILVEGEEDHPIFVAEEPLHPYWSEAVH